MAQKTEECKPYVVVKIRGTVSAQKEVRETLTFLHLTHTNHAVLIDSRPSYKGMLQRVNNYVTWGEPSKETVAMMLQKRARLAGEKKLTDEYIQKIGYKSIDDLAEVRPDSKPTPEERTAAHQTGEIIQDALNELPPEYREVIILKHVQELDYTEIAEILGISVGSLKVRAHRGREMLKRAIEKLEVSHG